MYIVHALFYIGPACLDIETTRRCYTLDRFCLKETDNKLNRKETTSTDDPFTVTVTMIALFVTIAIAIAVCLCLKKKSKLIIIFLI